jgi:hypothetical protein
VKRIWLGLLVLGLAQMTGDLLHVPWLRGLAAATAASPAPKVFTNHGDREPFSTHFAMILHASDGSTRRIQLTPERYARLAGPYNRRNALGAVLAAGPILRSDASTAAMFDQVSWYALCGEAPVLRELGVNAEEARSLLAVDLEYEARAAHAPRSFERVRVLCKEPKP